MSHKILAIDTTTENCSVALDIDGEVTQKVEYAPRDHSKKILPFVDELLKQAGLKLKDLDALAFGRGPGSFTGVRISVATAQGLAFGAKLPMIGVSTLQAMAQACLREHEASRCLAAIDARMGEVYWGEYVERDGLMVVEDQERVIAPDALEGHQQPCIAAGTGWETYHETLGRQFTGAQRSDKVLYPTAQDMLSYARQALAAGDTTDAASARPVYLRDTVTWKKLPGRE